METYNPTESYIRVGTACPEVNLADVVTNVGRITDLYQQAATDHTALLVFPELSITGYALGEFARNTALLDKAAQGLTELAAVTKGQPTAMVVGLPLEVGNGLYNCAAVVAEGQIKGIVPKSNLPTYGEFYEKRWYQKWENDNTTIEIDGQAVPFGTNLLFDIGGVKAGVEICEDLWVADSPSIDLAAKGALVIANPSASPELVSKAAYRRDVLIPGQASKLMAGYVYASCDFTDSTAEVVMGGHQIINENGRLIAERKPFTEGQQLMVADIDVEHLRHDRRKDTNYLNRLGGEVVRTIVKRAEISPRPNLSAHPFLPSGENVAERAERLQSIVDIQAYGLANRLRTSRSQHVLLGLSGGLDSTLALLVAHRAARIVGKEPADLIRTYTMPGEASSDRTQNNAVALANRLGIPNEVIPISEISAMELRLLHHDAATQDVTYENVQARARTNLLFNKANQIGGIVLGTGDLSEIALGWCTYNADQTSHYHVNGGVPKTLVRHLVNHLSETEQFASVKAILKDILDTPISPELTTAKAGEISQKTEDILGPYELHDFFLYHMIRWGDTPGKVRFLAGKAFEGVYDQATIDRTLGIFINRFITSQFKRVTSPELPKVGSVSLSKTGDWKVPADLNNPAVWQ